MKVITQPGFTVRVIDGISYSATNLTVVSWQGLYHLSFVCSGQMMLLPCRDIASVEFNLADRFYCSWCDAPLVSWPANEEEPIVRG